VTAAGLFELLLVLSALPVVAASGYLLLLSVLAWRRPPTPPGDTQPCFDLVVPAHNEEQGIAQTVRSLRQVNYPPERFRVLVVADNCTDQTGAQAAEAGAIVLARNDPDHRGKGYALELAFERSLAEGFSQAVVVVDADTLVSANLLQAFAARLSAGAVAVQAHYGVQNPNASWRTRLMVLALALFHRVRSLGRERLGVSCGLRGNGMCFSTRIIREVPHQAYSLVEDLEYGIRLGRAGHRVTYADEAEVFGEMVSGEKASRSQRRRWEQGRRAIARAQGWPLLRDALAQRSGLLLDLAADLLVPPLTLVVGASLLGTAVTFGWSVWLGRPSAALWLLTGCDLGLVAYVLTGWWRSGIGPRGLLDLAFAPLYVVWKLLLMVRSPKEKKDEWVRTAREGAPPR
jgi:cellulose synthase/poly-beta-1,6-N-acetylglucosamine synthase-like glycosyltransferase